MARILIDTSAWIEFYHPRGSAHVKQALQEALEHHEIALRAPIMIELLSGARTENDRELLQRDLETLIYLTVRWEEALAAAHLAWRLSRSGRRVPTTDLLIAGVALVHGCKVWHFGDSHFKVMEDFGGPSQRDLAPRSI
jgi:predicted nucleic acid-binding protein